MVKFTRKGCDISDEVIDLNISLKNMIFTDDLYFYGERSVEFGLLVCNKITGYCYSVYNNNLFLERKVSETYVVKDRGGTKEEHMQFLRQFLKREEYNKKRRNH